DDHRAAAAVAAVTAMFGSGEVGRVAQGEQQRRLGIELVMDRLAVDGHAGHGLSLACNTSPRDPMLRLMAIISTARGRIGFDELGGGGVPIVFLHGVGSDKSVWAPQLDHFGKSRRAVAFDYPGYGESEFVSGATRDDFAAWILAAMDALDIARADI